MKRNSLVLVLIALLLLGAFAVGMAAGQSGVPCALTATEGNYVYYSHFYSPNEKWLTCKYKAGRWITPDPDGSN